MNIQLRYRTVAGSPDCNLAVTDRYLTVNCVCIWPFHIPFSTDMPNGRNDYYFFYLWDGEMDILERGEIRTVAEGSAIIFPPNQRYFYRNNGGNGLYFCLHLSGNGLQEILRQCDIPIDRVIELGRNHEVQRLISEILELYITRPFCFEQQASNLAERIFLQIATKLHASERPTPARIANSLKLIHESYQFPITVEQLAQAEFLSVSHYRTLFRECTGQTPMEYITELRIKNAADFIERTSLPLKEIASMVGYSDQLYFSRVFKKELGISPQDYRKKMLQKNKEEQKSPTDSIF